MSDLSASRAELISSAYEVEQRVAGQQGFSKRRKTLRRASRAALAEDDFTDETGTEFVSDASADVSFVPDHELDQLA